MKVRVFDDVHIMSDYITDIKARNLLLTNGFSTITEMREKVIDIDLKDIVLEQDIEKRKPAYKMGFTYSNRLYNIIHGKHNLRNSDYDLQFEIIEDGFLDDIPYCETVFKTADEFNVWMKEKYAEENK
ncbi:hypothetical protein [Robinsoniella peoriensis]|uniref:hypothetical protein n=1 Tax=Robinsoniella peoriensis TaxID=180332 RepID=UPI00362EF28D